MDKVGFSGVFRGILQFYFYFINFIKFMVIKIHRLKTIRADRKASCSVYGTLSLGPDEDRLEWE